MTLVFVVYDSYEGETFIGKGDTWELALKDIEAMVGDPVSISDCTFYEGEHITVSAIVSVNSK